MSTTLQRLRNEAKTLPLDEREALLAVLDFDLHSELAIANTDDGTAVEADWDAEIDNRVTGIEAGQVTLLTHEQFMSVFDEARAELSGRGQTC